MVKNPLLANISYRLGLGTWKTSHKVAETIYEAIKMGYRHIDCAADYGNEVEVGQGVRKAIDEGIVTRDQLWITSKLWNTNHAKQHVKEACQKTLKDLGLSYLDLYLIHFPMPLEYVPINKRYPSGWYDSNDDNAKVIKAKIPLSETWSAMEDLVNEGLTHYIGVSNFDLQLLQDLLTYCRIRPIVNQVECHPFFQQRPLQRWCETENIVITAYSPFGGKSYLELGMAKESEPQVLTDPTLIRIAGKHHKSVAQIVLRWLFQQSPYFVMIPKSSDLSHLKENMTSFDFELSGEEMESIAHLGIHRRYNDPAIYTAQRGWWPIFS